MIIRFTSSTRVMTAQLFPVESVSLNYQRIIYLSKDVIHVSLSHADTL